MLVTAAPLEWHGLDTESEWMRPGYMAPRTVCMSYCAPGELPELRPTDEVWARLYTLLKRKTPIAAMNMAFDACCVIAWAPAEVRNLLLEAYEEDRVLDLYAAQRVLEIAGITRIFGLINLENLAIFWKLRQGKIVEKHDGTRDNYGPLLGQPLSAYSPKQKTYAKNDAVLHRDVARCQFDVLEAAGYSDAKAGICMLSRDLLWCMRTSNTGMTTNPERVAKLEAALMPEIEKLKERAIANGFVRDENGRTRAGEWPKGKPGSTNKGQVKAMLQADGSRYVTEKGAISTSKEALGEAKDPRLVDFARYGQLTYVANKDLKLLKRGAHEPIHCRFNLADSLRLIAESPNMQNWARDPMMLGGEEHAVRYCFEPEDGWCYLGCDFEGLEMVSLGEVVETNVGSSHLADQIRNGVDVLSKIAAVIGNKPYDWVLKNKKTDRDTFLNRQASKATAYGMMGGMSNPETLQSSAKKSYQVRLSIPKVIEVMKAVRVAQPDIPRYLNWCKKLPRNHKGYKMKMPGALGLYRRERSMPSIANGGFQTMGSRIASCVGWRIMREQLDEDSALWGTHICAFIHDEFILEAPLRRRSEAARRFQEIMCTEPSSSRGPLRRLKISGDVVCMSYWNKHAQAKWDDRGRIIVF